MDGAFEEKGKTVGVTDSLGRYSVQALLGRVSENFDVGRALSSGLIGIIAGGATNRTKRLDITRLDMRITAEGHKAYLGVVPCRSLYAGRFSVTMEPVLLAPSNAAIASAVAEGWGAVRLVDARVEPSVVRPGENATLLAEVRVPAAVALRDLTVVAVSDVWGKKRLDARDSASEGGVTRVTATVKAPKVRTATSIAVLFVIEKAPLDVINEIPLRRYMEVTAAGGDEGLAQERSAARSALAEGRPAEALALLKQISGTGLASEQDLLLLGEVARELGDYPTAIGALEQAAFRADDRLKAYAAARHAETLLLAGNPQQVVKAYGPYVEEKDRSERSRVVSVPLLVTLGEAYLAVGEFAKAREMVDRLHKQGGRLPVRAIQLRGALRLAEAQKAYDADRNNPEQEMALARALIDVGRYEEALPLLRGAKQQGYALPAVNADLMYATTRLSVDTTDTAAPLDVALHEARKAVRILDGKKERKSRDFFSWHRLAMLLYAKYEQVGAQTEQAAPLLKECIEALDEAVVCARAGAAVDEGLYAPYVGFGSPRLVAITGYAYPEAANDYVLMNGLRILQRNPSDEFALFNVAAALVDLRHNAAGAAVERARAAWGDHPDYTFLRGLWARRDGDDTTALECFRRTITLNPLHARARLEIATLLMERGDMVGSADALAEHAAIYGRHHEPELGKE